MATKKVNKAKKLQPVTLPERENGNDVPLLEWKPFNKGVSVTGHITKMADFKNRFNQQTSIIEFDADEITSEDDDNKFTDKYAPSDGEPVSIKMFKPAALRDLLARVDTDDLVQIIYHGKDDDGHHVFEVNAETVLPE